MCRDTSSLLIWLKANTIQKQIIINKVRRDFNLIGTVCIHISTTFPVSLEQEENAA